MLKSLKITGLFLLAALLIIGATSLFAEELTPQTVCPVMGGKIDKNLYVDADGKRIYVCCRGCIEKVKADPKKYITQLEEQGITLEKTPVQP